LRGILIKGTFYFSFSMDLRISGGEKLGEGKTTVEPLDRAAIAPTTLPKQ
jgi:hypothetical protein